MAQTEPHLWESHKEQNKAEQFRFLLSCGKDHRGLTVSLVLSHQLLLWKVTSSLSPGPVTLAEIKVNTCNIIVEGKRERAIEGNSWTNTENRENRHFHTSTNLHLLGPSTNLGYVIEKSNDTNTSRMLSPGRFSPSVCSVGSQATWSPMVSEDGIAQGAAAIMEAHSHSGKLHVTPTATFTGAIRQPGLVRASVSFLVLVVAPQKA